MALFAIGDLHLSFGHDKPMDVFGEQWEEHYKKIEDSWRELITDDDTVIIAGDSSWAMHLRDAKEDLAWIAALPGEKVFVKGNHDYWWSTVAKMKKEYPDFLFLHNNYVESNGYVLCGSRGWLCPNETKFDDDDRRIYEREAIRMKLSFDAAKKDGLSTPIVVTHYPPTNDKFEESLFTKLFHEYGVKHAIYGHLHDKTGFAMGIKGEHDGINYHLVSCDYLDFKVIKILD